MNNWRPRRHRSRLPLCQPAEQAQTNRGGLQSQGPGRQSVTDVPFVFVGIWGSVKLGETTRQFCPAAQSNTHSCRDCGHWFIGVYLQAGTGQSQLQGSGGQGLQFGVPLGRRRRVKHTASVIHIKHQRAIHTEPVILIHHVTADKITHLQHQLLKQFNSDELSSELITDTNR